MFKKKWVKVLCVILTVILFVTVFIIIGNIICNNKLRKYINSFEPVKYGADRVVPVMEDGYMTVTTDRELKVMHITDVHLGGGIFTYKNDKKTIYELITMLQNEAPDIVVCGGDNTYCVIPIGYNGGGTFNNLMVAKTFISIFDHEEVYFTTVFGNHDTEAMDKANRQEIGDLYAGDFSKYCFFVQDFTDLDAKTIPSVSNQFIKVKNKDGEVVRLILLIDSNDYEDTKFFTSVFGKYDTIHDAQVEWAKETIEKLSHEAGLPSGEYLKTTCFVHIPMGEYRTALDELIEEVRDEKGKIVEFKQRQGATDTKFIGGSWGEEKVCYGGISREGIAPNDLDNFFEVLCDEMKAVDSVFCGHDHVNDAVVYYKDVMLAYGYSVDNEAYGDKIMSAGLQRGATVITINQDGSFTQVHKNAYKDYGVDPNKFVPVDVDKKLYPDMYRTVIE